MFKNMISLVATNTPVRNAVPKNGAKLIFLNSSIPKSLMKNFIIIHFFLHGTIKKKLKKKKKNT
jgi:hypothetical protein